MDTISNLVLGASVAFTGTNLLFAVAGTIVGMLVGVLPGLGPAAATALLLPLTFGLSPTGAIIMLAAIYYGSQFGGTITSVLLNVPARPAARSPASTAIRWQNRAGRGPRSRLPRWDP